MKNCRFDHVATATHALRVYMDTCAREDNTLQLVETAEEAVKQLVKIEKQLKSKASARPLKSIGSSVDEFHKKNKELKIVAASVGAFLGEHKDAFDKVEEMAKNIRAIKMIHTRLNNLRSEINKKFKLVTTEDEEDETSLEVVAG